MMPQVAAVWIMYLLLSDFDPLLLLSLSLSPVVSCPAMIHVSLRLMFCLQRDSPTCLEVIHHCVN